MTLEAPRTISEVDAMTQPQDIWQRVEHLVSDYEPGKLASLGIREVGKHAPDGWLTVQSFYRCLAWDIPMLHYFWCVIYDATPVRV